VPDAQQNGGPTGSGVNSSAAAADAINEVLNVSGESTTVPLRCSRPALAKTEESGYRTNPRLRVVCGAGV